MIGIPFQIIYQPELKESVKEIFHDIFTLLVRNVLLWTSNLYSIYGNRQQIQNKTWGLY